MTDRQKEIYANIQSYLESHGRYNPIDKYELSRLVEAIDLYKKYHDIIQARDPEKVDKGFSQTSAYLIWKRMDDVIQKLADKYGLTAIGRKRLGITTDSEDADPLDNFL